MSRTGCGLPVRDIPTRERSLWPATVKNAHCGKIACWETSATADTGLIPTALELGLFGRDVLGGFQWAAQHLDRGVLRGKTVRVGDGGDGTSGDAFAEAASDPPGRGAGVLDQDR